MNTGVDGCENDGFRVLASNDFGLSKFAGE
jgi:hypothetical protein